MKRMSLRKCIGLLILGQFLLLSFLASSDLKFLSKTEMTGATGAGDDCFDYLITFDCTQSYECYKHTDPENHAACSNSGNCDLMCDGSGAYNFIVTQTEPTTKDYMYWTNQWSTCGKKIDDANSFCTWSATHSQCRCTNLGGISTDACIFKDPFVAANCPST